jgi:hypothetical protein
MTTVTRFNDGRRVEESDVFAMGGQVRQRRFSFEERTRAGEVTRRFTVDFETGRAQSWRRSATGEIAQSEKVLRGTRDAFAGLGVMLAIKNLHAALDSGAPATLGVVAFVPSPLVVDVTVARVEQTDLAIGGRVLPASRYRIRPDIPGVVKVFMKAPDQTMWFTRASPPAFLRADINLVEPSDPVVRFEALGG